MTVAWGERDRILPPWQAERLVAGTILRTTGGAPAQDPTAGAAAG